MGATLLDPLVLDRRPDADSPRVELASAPLPSAARLRQERRAYQRLRQTELEWVRIARLAAGKGVSLVDLSAGGALIDSPVPLRPESMLTLEIAGHGIETAVQFRVLRCQIGAIGEQGAIYRAACEFTRLIELPGLRTGTAHESMPGAFIGLDLALKQLVERAGPVDTDRSLDPECILHALRALHGRALKQPLDPIGNPLASLLGQVVPALERDAGLPSILQGLEQQLRLTVPQASLRITSDGDAPAPGVRSILINAPGATEALVSIDIPRGVVLNDWQSRVLRITTRVVALLQRLASDTEEPASTPATNAFAAASDAGASVPSSEVDEPALPSAWQKIVVRYAEGQILKGYTQDFSATRAQFSLWPSMTASPQERVIVPLARLKGVFFVRDFAGNPGYVERPDSGGPQHGRRIEVTLVDDEVIVGRTLSYRPDGHGFFVVPSDPLANNIRVFIVAASVRQVRFP